MAPLDTAALDTTLLGTARTAQQHWRTITTGGSRIVHWYDRGGRRYVVIQPTPAGNAPAFTPRQREILARRAAGQALKVAAIELGVSLATVSRELDRALAKLGLESATDLVQVLGHAVAG
jgi:DNA-binding NarL/FixJ family response regulator